MGYDEVVGHPSGVGVERPNDAQGNGGPDELGNDKAGHRGRGDAGEAVGEGSADRDRRVGEAGGAGEPKGSADVGADGRRCRAGLAGASQSDDQYEQAGRRHHLTEQQVPGRAGLADQVTAASAYIRLARMAPAMAPTTCAGR